MIVEQAAGGTPRAVGAAAGGKGGRRGGGCGDGSSRGSSGVLLESGVQELQGPSASLFTNMPRMDELAEASSDSPTTKICRRAGRRPCWLPSLPSVLRHRASSAQTGYRDGCYRCCCCYCYCSCCCWTFSAAVRSNSISSSLSALLPLVADEEDGEAMSPIPSGQPSQERKSRRRNVSRACAARNSGQRVINREADDDDDDDDDDEAAFPATFRCCCCCCCCWCWSWRVICDPPSMVEVGPERRHCHRQALRRHHSPRRRCHRLVVLHQRVRTPFLPRLALLFRPASPD